MLRYLLLGLVLQSFSHVLPGQPLRLDGLQDSVEIIVDEWGVPHIYAQNEADLFFAQGYYAASDRLFQFEIWRRQATGTVAEILGPRELKRDMGTRLFMFRGDIRREMNHYHPRGELIITSFVRGVNAYIEQALEDPEALPLEFSLLGIEPKPWTPEVVISRHQGLLGNVGDELDLARLVATLGEERVRDFSWFHPNDPNLTFAPQLDPELFFDDILELYNAYRRPIRFQPEDLVAAVQNPNMEEYRRLARQQAWDQEEANRTDIGSNNWVVSGEHTLSGFPMMANDPHRTLAVPSLRYMAHLHAPGWNVIGGGEPEIPGISIGHNEYGAWGLTVFETDAEDLYVYRTNPDDPGQYWYEGRWEDMYIIRDTIPVEGQAAEVVELKYSRHGPVLYEDESKNTAVAMRCGWLEIGGSPYLASLRMNQSRNFEEFREACAYSHIPGENMVWADRAGNIGWQAVGIQPIRRGFSGLLPLPGDGSHEWDGYLPIQAKPHLFNPVGGMIATSNQHVTPPDYPFPDALGYTWSDPYRGARVEEVLASGRKHSLADMMRLQTDYLSLPARTLVPLLEPLNSEDERIESARTHLIKWDYRLVKNSVAATIYDAWEDALREQVSALLVPQEARSWSYVQLKTVIDALLLPDESFGENPLKGRDDLLLSALDAALAAVESRLGDDMDQWQYGQEANKHVRFRHPLSPAVSPTVRRQLEVGPFPRGGNSYTVNNTSGALNQSSGGTFRIIVDTGDWDHCVATNAPGQAGNPDDPHYDNLAGMWANDQFFPLFFSREKIERVAEEEIRLFPNQ